MTDPKPPSIPPEHEEVTAVWDEDAARQHGFEIAGKAAGPATAPAVRGQDGSSVVVSSGLTGRHPAQPPAPVEPRSHGGGLSWPAAIAIALSVGVAVFFLVRLLR